MSFFLSEYQISSADSCRLDILALELGWCDLQTFDQYERFYLVAYGISLLTYRLFSMHGLVQDYYKVVWLQLFKGSDHPKLIFQCLVDFGALNHLIVT